MKSLRSRALFASLALSSLAACSGNSGVPSTPVGPGTATVAGAAAGAAAASPASIETIDARVKKVATGVTTAMPAISSDGFVSTMGVDVDLVSPPDAQQTQLAHSFAGLGVRHTRIAVLESNAHYNAIVQNFFAVNPNVRAYGLTNCAPPLGPYTAAAIGPNDAGAFQTAIGNHLDFIEGVNEPDNRGDANWVADTKSCLAPLANGALPLVAPALVTHSDGTSQEQLGDLTGTASVGNIHRYFAGRNPGTSGWGGADACGSYGGLAWSICWARVTTPHAPLVVTETGWNSDSEVDLATQAKYVERVFFVNAQAGIAATSVYTLQSYAGGDGFGGDGLVTSSFAPKPAYLALANLTKLLADPGASFAAAPLAVAMSPAPTAGSGLQAMVLEKRSGTYEIALWQEVQSANPDAYATDTPAAPMTVTLSLGSVWRATTHAWQDNGSAPATALGKNSVFTVPVSDRMTIVELKRG